MAVFQTVITVASGQIEVRFMELIEFIYYLEECLNSHSSKSKQQSPDTKHKTTLKILCWEIISVAPKLSLAQIQTKLEIHMLAKFLTDNFA